MIGRAGRDGAWATLLTREDYLPGVRVLRHSLGEVATAYPLIVMVTDGVSGAARDVLRADGCDVVEVDRVDAPDGAHSYVFEHFSEVWTKLRAWRLDVDRVVLLDADMLVVAGMDDLMTMPLPDGGIAACHTCRCNPEHHDDYPEDWVPQRCWFSYAPGGAEAGEPPADLEPYFNSGLVVLRPDPDVFSALVGRIADLDLDRYPFPDQDLLNEYFRGRWTALGWGDNALKTLAVQHPHVWDLAQVRNLHFLLAKPWSGATPEDPTYAELDRRWHDAAVRAGVEVPRPGGPVPGPGRTSAT